MGINFSHGEGRFGYAQFHRVIFMIEAYALFLEDILKRPMTGHNESENYDWKKNNPNVVERIEALKPLIEHSDCDGELTVLQLKKLYPVINKILSNWEIDKVALAGFAGSIKDAIDENEPLKFV